MVQTFKKLTLEEFVTLVNRFEFTRRINAVHMHHTWKPERRDFRGQETIAAMWRYHTEVNGWRDLAQHITIDPDGFIWLGRNWNLPPASAAGHNGNIHVGPFMFEMVGNFDTGHDVFDGAQRHAAIQVIAVVQLKFGLRPETLHFHHDMSPKTCPGSGIDYADIVAEVSAASAALIAELGNGARDVAAGLFGEEWIERNRAVDEAVRWLTREIPHREEPFDAEQDHEEEHFDTMTRSRGLAETGLGPEQLDMLRPHLVDLNMGRFSQDGAFKTSQGDVDAIFLDHLTKEMKNREEVGSRKLRLVFFAHGGLVKESSGLEIAWKHLNWWRKNDIYPIYFIWETGFFETIGQLLQRTRDKSRQQLTRDFWDYTTDPLIEMSVRALQGPRIWGGMKQSAALASAPWSPDGAAAAGEEGGAYYVARQLKAFCDKYQDRVELHAVGHSAGSIFLGHFLPAAIEMGVPSFKSVHLLAPAIRVDEFLKCYPPILGENRGIDSLCLFTMRKDFERGDNCAQIYHKSLLYLIYYALEPEPHCPILGLEASLREDPQLRNIFGLGGTAGKNAEIVWSRSESASGRYASRSVSHGGFDDDSATMNSVLRRIQNKDDMEQIVEYQPDTSRSAQPVSWIDEVDWPEQLTHPVSSPVTVSPILAPSGTGSTTSVGSSDRINIAASAGRRRALCVGIDDYPAAPLRGCVADTRMWENSLQHLDFAPPVTLLNGEATRQAIISNLRELVLSSRTGDVLVFQYSGHGTQLPDLNGDEADGDTPGFDEALCPVDYASGAFLIDDDVGEIFALIPPGVNVTCFMDCCHSGTITRFAVGKPTDGGAVVSDWRPRFLVPSAQMIAAHQQFRKSRGELGRSAAVSGGLSQMKEILFAACLSSEVAWERSGHGEFTLRATRVLESSSALTNQQFEQKVREAFGAAPRQHAALYCAPAMTSKLLLQPLG